MVTAKLDFVSVIVRCKTSGGEFLNARMFDL
jgi:hypothetical protein